MSSASHLGVRDRLGGTSGIFREEEDVVALEDCEPPPHVLSRLIGRADMAGEGCWLGKGPLFCPVGWMREEAEPARLLLSGGEEGPC